jgi:hypothetical protein
MKTSHKSLISFISPTVGLVLLGFWVLNSEKSFDMPGYLILGISILLIGLGLYFRVQGFQNARLGLSSDDELSYRMKEKAAAKAFLYSVYMWLFAILFIFDLEPREKIIIGFGLLGMILIFFLNWLYYSKVGISDEDQN